jgi:catechol 2,3-dioxygenase-like lactoylglutathione lyase family enzyme
LSLHHVALEVRREAVEDEVAFWALLGFAEVDAPPTLRERATWLQAGERQVHLLYAEDPVVPPQGHCAVVVEEFHATLRRLREAGIEAEERARHWGAPRCLATSPAGHRVEVMAFPPE